jgi:hypothetical protein
MDPFGEDDDNPILDTEPSFLDDENTISPETEEKLNKDLKSIKSNSIRVMATPMGIIPVTENTASSKIFNFWVGHTNFNISRKIAQIIEDTNGVETLDVFTRYRFRIAIGKVFTDSNVMKNINDNVYEYLG